MILVHCLLHKFSLTRKSSVTRQHTELLSLEICPTNKNLVVYIICAIVEEAFRKPTCTCVGNDFPAEFQTILSKFYGAKYTN